MLVLRGARSLSAQSSGYNWLASTATSWKRVSGSILKNSHVSSRSFTGRAVCYRAPGLPLTTQQVENSYRLANSCGVFCLEWRTSSLVLLPSIFSQGQPRVYSTDSTETSINRVALWGNGDFGRLGLGGARSVNVPTLCPHLRGSDARQVACGGAHTLVLTGDGRVHATGLNDCGQLGLSPTTPFLQVPAVVEGLPAASHVSAGHYHSACISEAGEVFTWGSHKEGQLGLGTEAEGRVWRAARVKALAGVRVVGLALGATHSLALAEDGRVYSWGSSAHGQLGHGRASLFQRLVGPRETRPRLVRGLQSRQMQVVAAGHLHSASIDEYGRLHTFGAGRCWQLGTGRNADADSAQMVAELPALEQVACGGSHTLAATVRGDVYSWGANEGGCLGLGRGHPSYARRPMPVEGQLAEHTAVQVASGWKHSAAVTAGGRLFMWGWGGSQGSHSTEDASSGGQLGLGNEFDYAEPTIVAHGALAPRLRGNGSSAMPRALQVSCGFNHTAAIVELPGGT